MAGQLPAAPIALVVTPLAFPVAPRALPVVAIASPVVSAVVRRPDVAAARHPGSGPPSVSDVVAGLPDVPRIRSVGAIVVTTLAIRPGRDGDGRRTDANMNREACVRVRRRDAQRAEQNHQTSNPQHHVLHNRLHLPDGTANAMPATNARILAEF